MIVLYIEIILYYHMYQCIAPHLLTTVRSITALQGQSISFDCIPMPNNTMIQWSHDGRRILSSGQATLSPPNLHHTLSISNLDVSDSGVYTCYVDGSKQYINRTINVTVLRGVYMHSEKLSTLQKTLCACMVTYAPVY